MNLSRRTHRANTVIGIVVTVMVIGGLLISLYLLLTSSTTAGTSSIPRY